MPIYTKNGDTGFTSTLTVKNLKKSQPVFEVLGTIDELNACLGFLSNSGFSSTIKEIQRDLLLMGAFIAGKKFLVSSAKIWESKILGLEKLIDKFDADNEPLKNFILPGGSPESSYFHLSRAVCRRLERCLVRGVVKGKSQKHYLAFIKYANRLADLLFVLARTANKNAGIKDLLWKGDKI